jgi:hypothetical protein
VTRRPSRKCAAALLVLAGFGFVAAPVLHAQRHAAEAERDAEMARLLARLGQHGDDFDEAFALLWRMGREHKAPHSHGPARAPGNRHGKDTLEHFALALHSAPPPPVAPAPRPEPLIAVEVAHEAPPPEAWRTPPRAQGPPNS